MANVIIIHGTEGNPNENWFPWLKGKLESEGWNVFIPKFPTPINQSLDSWMEVFEEYRKYLDRDSIIIGHSLGPAFILSVLGSLDKPIKAAFLVSGFIGELGNERYDKLNDSFINRDFDWDKIKMNCREFFVINSDDDPYVPLEKGRELAVKLGTELIVVHGGGHINSDSGYGEFDLLLEKILGKVY